MDSQKHQANMAADYQFIYVSFLWWHIQWSYRTVCNDSEALCICSQF